MITLYNVLGVKDNATLEEIKASYRKLSLIYHPDVTGGNSEMYLKIQNAYNTLSDPQKRMEYDMRLYRLMHQSNNDNMRGQQNKENEYNNVTHQYRESRQANSSSKTSTNKDKQRQSAYHQAGVGCLTILAKSLQSYYHYIRKWCIFCTVDFISGGCKNHELYFSSRNFRKTRTPDR